MMAGALGMMYMVDRSIGDSFPSDRRRVPRLDMAKWSIDCPDHGA